MKRIFPLIVLLLLGSLPFCYWLLPHKNALVRRAENGDVQAMYDVGIAHLSVSGKGVINPRSDRDPVYWFRMAANHGHNGAMYVLADLDIPNEEKVMWLKKGAALGNKACMVELMNGHCSGSYGLPIDIGAFLYWEARVSEATRKDNKKQPDEIALEGRMGEIRRRKELKYDGLIRPL